MCGVSDNSYTDDFDIFDFSSSIIFCNQNSGSQDCRSGLSYVPKSHLFIYFWRESVCACVCIVVRMPQRFNWSHRGVREIIIETDSKTYFVIQSMATPYWLTTEFHRNLFMFTINMVRPDGTLIRCHVANICLFRSPNSHTFRIHFSTRSDRFRS